MHKVKTGKELIEKVKERIIELETKIAELKRSIHDRSNLTLIERTLATNVEVLKAMQGK